jgi:AcrR family transcriptional regulator
MNEDKEIKDRIRIRADEMFSKHGYSKITMEEIAATLGISKRTLYKHYSNKESILKEIVSTAKCEIESFIEELINNKKLQFIEKLKIFMNFIAKQTARLESPLTDDLMKCTPEIWHDIVEFRKNRTYKHFSELIEQGKKSRTFTKNINTEVIVIAYVSAIHSLISPGTLATLPISADQAYREIMKIFFDGIFTEEGRNKYRTTSLLKDNMENRPHDKI